MHSIWPSCKTDTDCRNVSVTARRRSETSLPQQMNRRLIFLYLSSVALTIIRVTDASPKALWLHATHNRQIAQRPCNCSFKTQAALKVFERRGDGDKEISGPKSSRLSRPSTKSVKASPHIYVRYAACLGLANQLYSHIAALAVAARTGADLILAPATYRSSFKHAFNSADAQWRSASTSTILDVDSIITFWRQRGITVHRVSSCTLP